jgi:hypothetical protein
MGVEQIGNGIVRVREGGESAERGMKGEHCQMIGDKGEKTKKQMRMAIKTSKNGGRDEKVG